jgi:hypothetical protein
MSSTEFLINFVLATLAVWRVAHLLVHEDGPKGLIAQLRTLAAGTEIGRALDCVGCMSLWLALPASVWVSRRLSEFLPTWLALSGAAFLLERIGSEPLIVERLVSTETFQSEGVSNDELLRTESDDPGHGEPGDV